MPVDLALIGEGTRGLKGDLCGPVEDLARARTFQGRLCAISSICNREIVSFCDSDQFLVCFGKLIVLDQARKVFERMRPE